MFIIGWNYLSIRSNENYPNFDQAYAAGFLEGALTAKQMYIQIKIRFPDPAPPQKVQRFFDENAKWEEEEKASGRHPDYWEQRSLLDVQVDGIYDGYMSKATGAMVRLFCLSDAQRNVTRYQVIVATYEYDVWDLSIVLPDDESKCFDEPLFRNECHGAERVDHCSALLKILPGYTDVMFSHVTWAGAQSMYRVYKAYDLNLHLSNGDLIPGHKVAMASYPGRFTSGDDFYITSARLAIQETTISIWDESLNKNIKPQSVYQWARSALATRLASWDPTFSMTCRSAEEWVEWYALYNSGLYNNQWMVFDYNRFTPGQPPEDGAFWIFEQIPGGGLSSDMTWWLRREGYWASYNIPYFKSIYEACGYPAKVEEWEPKAMSWEQAARAQIFRRDHHKVVDLASMARMMRYNDYKHDPISACNCTPPYTSQYTISSRSELLDKNGTYPFPSLGFRDHMGTDVKITSAALLDDHLGAAIICGPTYDQQPVFEWATTPLGPLDHEDYPEKYDFPFYIARMDVDGEMGFDYVPFDHLKNWCVCSKKFFS